MSCLFSSASPCKYIPHVFLFVQIRAEHQRESAESSLMANTRMVSSEQRPTEGHGVISTSEHMQPSHYLYVPNSAGNVLNGYMNSQ